MPSRLALNDLRELAWSRGGKLHCTSYLDSKSPLNWECGNGHVWLATASKVKFGTWCPTCAKRVRLEIGELQALAISRGGQLLSERYRNANTPLLWQCEFGHQWGATSGSVKNQGTWCPNCAGNRKLELYDLQLIAVSRSGRLVSTLYVNSTSALLWECSSGHQWTANAAGVKAGTWCPRCAGRKPELADFQAVAISRGGRLLSNEYVNSYTPLTWACSVGHHWTATSDSVKKGRHWCPQCSGNARINLADLAALAMAHGNRLLSTAYLNRSSPLLWECVAGHQWTASAAAVKQLQSWCPECAGRAKLTIGDLQDLAKARGGLLLSDTYNNARTKLLWQCAREHQWRATINHIKYSGTWCPTCGDSKVGDALRLDISVFREIATQRGGKLLSDRYVNDRSRLVWECAVGHQWTARAGHIKNAPSWCPTCASGKGERMTRRCFENIFRRPFPRLQAPWLRRQHLDGFCPDLFLAFEYDGAQHFETIGKFRMTERDLQMNIQRDRRKDQLCRNNGVTLVRVKEVRPLTEAAVLRSVVEAIRGHTAAMAIVNASRVTLPLK